MLESQLRRLGVFGAEETISSHPNFDESFKFCAYIHFLFQIICFKKMIMLLVMLVVIVFYLPNHHSFCGSSTM